MTYVDSNIGRCTDPHSNLPCHTLTDEEHRRALHCILSKNISQWQLLASSWNIGNNSFIWCDMFLKLRLPSLMLNKTHGPKLVDGSIAPMLAFILNKSDIKGGGGTKRGGMSKKAIEAAKERAAKKTGTSNDDNDGDYAQGKGNKRITGLWRHVEWRRCGIGMTAMSLFVQFYNVSDRAVHFYDSDDRNKQPHWWKRKVWPQWKDTRVAGTAYSRVLKDSNISWGKVIHMRSAGIEFASSHGKLDGGSVSTMSKHQTSKLEKAYLTELHPQVMRVMSGHKKDDKYYVPRALLTLPWSDDQICQHIFPKLALWQSQFRNPLGDHSKAAENMLFDLLPYLAKVVVQDGIYWVNSYPDHEVTRLLLNTMPPEYERWAAKAQGDIEQLVLAKQDVLVSDLNDAAKAALTKVLDRLDQRFDRQMVE